MGYGQKNQERKRANSLTATGVFGKNIPSEPSLLGRRLVLKFSGRENPELDRIEFRANNRTPKFEYLQRDNLDDTTRTFRSDKVPKALPLLLLDYLCARLQKPPRFHQLDGGTGSLAATVGFALSDTDGPWRRLFTEFLQDGGKLLRVKRVFGGRNHHGKGAGDRVVFINPDYLPPDCLDVYWSEQRLDGLAQIRTLTEQFRKAWELPPPNLLVLPAKEELEEPPQPVPSKKRTSEPTPKPPITEKASPKADSKPSDTERADLIKEEIPANAPEPPQATAPNYKGTEKNSVPSPKPPPKIDSQLLEIRNPPGMEWSNHDPLLNFGDPDNDIDVWRIKDASEGLLIFGAVGSGKTSGSGSAAAKAFLNAGYGGLILTAKPDEAARWLRLCECTGRAYDCVHVTPTSGHKLNILQYESQRSGVRVSITDDLIALFRCLLESMAHDGKQSHGPRERFWENTTDEVMRNLFDLFELAQEILTIENLTHFLSAAPQGFEKPWTAYDYFADLLVEAERNVKAGTDEDDRIFRRVFTYWTKEYPNLYPATRSGIYANFSSMASILSGRGIYELVSTETNLTPEMILSGKIVVLDFPLKGNVKSGLMVQAAWKLLFQQAVERRADKGQPTARPVFLWEDEGHLFFSHYDVDFQPTARDCRAAHVIMSQNIHNFLHLGHSPHGVYAVFAAMNTYILHTNSDFETNEWVSKRIGDEKNIKLKASGLLLRSPSEEDLAFFETRRPDDVKSIGAFSWTEERKRAIPPEDFGKLKKGGDGICEAIILWLSHKFAVNGGKQYNRIWFEQE